MRPQPSGSPQSFTPPVYPLSSEASSETFLTPPIDASQLDYEEPCLALDVQTGLSRYRVDLFVRPGTLAPMQQELHEASLNASCESSAEGSRIEKKQEPLDFLLPPLTMNHTMHTAVSLSPLYEEK